MQRGAREKERRGESAVNEPLPEAVREGAALPDSEQPLNLEADAPLRMLQAVGHRELAVTLHGWPMHRLQEEVPEGQSVELLRLQAVLRVHELQLITAIDEQRRAGLRADGDPVDARNERARAVGLDAHLEPAGVESLDQWRVELEERFPPVQMTIGRPPRAASGQ